MADHLVSEALYLWDPDGLGIEIYVDRPLIEWELMVPSGADVEDATRNLRDAGDGVEKTPHGVAAADPWGTRVHIRPER
jgi:catechol-2,3-dioxygenase